MKPRVPCLIVPANSGTAGRRDSDEQGRGGGGTSTPASPKTIVASGRQSGRSLRIGAYVTGGPPDDRAAAGSETLRGWATEVVPATGSSQGVSRQELDTIMSEDPYRAAGPVKHEIIELDPTRCQPSSADPLGLSDL